MRWFDWIAAALSLVICLYISVRYEPLTYEIALLPLEGIVGSAILVLLVLEATRRTAGATLVAIILILIVLLEFQLGRARAREGWQGETPAVPTMSR